MWIIISDVMYNIYGSLFKKYTHKHDVEQGTVETGYSLKEIIIHKLLW